MKIKGKSEKIEMTLAELQKYDFHENNIKKYKKAENGRYLVPLRHVILKASFDEKWRRKIE